MLKNENLVARILYSLSGTANFLIDLESQKSTVPDVSEEFARWDCIQTKPQKYYKTNYVSKRCVVPGTHESPKVICVTRFWYTSDVYGHEGAPFVVGVIAEGRRTWALVPGRWHRCRRWFRDPGAICRGSRARSDDGARWAARRWCSWYRAGCSSHGAGCHDAGSRWRARGPRPRSSCHAGSVSRCYRRPTAAPASRNRSPPCCWPCLGWRSAPSRSHLPGNKRARGCGQFGIDYYSGRYTELYEFAGKLDSFESLASRTRCVQ